MFQDSDFGDKMSFTVGASYFMGFVLGLARGIRQGIPKSLRIPRKLIMNTLMYYLLGGGLNLLFED